MLSLPDFREKQILLVNAEYGSKPALRFQNDNIVFEKEGVVINRASCHKVFAVYVAGEISITSALLRKGHEHGVSLYLAKPNFEVYVSLTAEASGNYLLRQKQYTLPESRELSVARHLIKNKIENQLRLLKSNKKIENLAQEKIKYFALIDNIQDNKSLLGIEGSMSRRFYNAYFKEMGWRRRAPRSKEDVVNFLMDMGYTFLFNLVDGLLLLHGFDTYKGCYHKLFFQRKSLACDLMEPFRCIIDKKILTMYHLKQIDEKDFRIVQGKISLDFQHNAKYAKFFAEVLMNHKEELYTYMQNFYRHIMDEHNSLTVFTLKIK